MVDSLTLTAQGASRPEEPTQCSEAKYISAKSSCDNSTNINTIYKNSTNNDNSININIKLTILNFKKIVPIIQILILMLIISIIPILIIMIQGNAVGFSVFGLQTSRASGFAALGFKGFGIGGS